MADQTTRDELNRLYWQSEESVSAIADRLDISRRALYDAIDPLPVDAVCPGCGGALGFRNRTMAENREAECQRCGREVELGGVHEPEPQVEQERAAAPLSPTRRGAGGNGAALGAMLLVGIGLGAAVAYLIHRA